MCGGANAWRDDAFRGNPNCLSPPVLLSCLLRIAQLFVRDRLAVIHAPPTSALRPQHASAWCCRFPSPPFGAASLAQAALPLAQSMVSGISPYGGLCLAQ